MKSEQEDVAGNYFKPVRSNRSEVFLGFVRSSTNANVCLSMGVKFD